MNVYCAPYELVPKNGGPPRKGSLLRVHFDKNLIGYADCHPWPEMGDLPIGKQLVHLSKGKFTPLTTQSLQLAYFDANARSVDKSLFCDLAIPPSYCLLDSLDDAVPQGFACCKIKLGFDVEEECRKLPAFMDAFKQGRVRLDFNCRVDRGTFLRYAEVLKPYASQLDYIEDPFPYDRAEWAACQKKTGIPFACDFATESNFSDRSSHSIVVLKPAVQDCSRFAGKGTHRIVCTSYLDHPLGQLAAAWTAAALARSCKEMMLPCGLMSHLHYQTNTYSENLDVEGDRLMIPEGGTGFGFDEQLRTERWTEL